MKPDGRRARISRWVPVVARLAAVAAAWAAGWIVYVIAALLWNGDGLVSMVVQVPAGAAISAFGVGAAWLAGQVLRLPPLRRAWLPPAAASLVLACVAVMLLGSRVGLVFTYVDPDTGASFPALHPAAALGAYFGLLFALANWPLAAPRVKPRLAEV